jgi:sulfopropanediol 3-dehydrogenase
LAEYLKRAEAEPPAVSDEIRTTVEGILRDVERDGIDAVRRWSSKLDDWDPPSFRVSDEEIERAKSTLDPELKQHIAFAQAQIRGFAELQMQTLVDVERETLPGVVLGHRHVPVNSVGSYSPGGRYPMLASSIMTIAVPKVAGVKRVAACAPPQGGEGIYPAQLYAMASSGADEIYCLGGVQALAALAFGAGIDAVDMIVGAGNAYVAEAKRQLFGTVGIDLLAGPTEILIIADENADPELVAADLLGQAEHGPTSPAVLVTDSRELGQRTIAAVEKWLAEWPTAEVAGQAWRERGEVVVCESREEVVAVADDYAPEHLEVQTADSDWYLDHLSNYGSLFLGEHSTVVYSDKAIGTNHVLPTAGAARYTGGLWVGKFTKVLTYQKVTGEGTREVAPAAAAISDAERMLGHALTARIRMDRVTEAGAA